LRVVGFACESDVLKGAMAKSALSLDQDDMDSTNHGTKQPLIRLNLCDRLSGCNGYAALHSAYVQYPLFSPVICRFRKLIGCINVLRSNLAYHPNVISLTVRPCNSCTYRKRHKAPLTGRTAVPTLQQLASSYPLYKIEYRTAGRREYLSA
jgi:hypothetical protein